MNLFTNYKKDDISKCSGINHLPCTQARTASQEDQDQVDQQDQRVPPAREVTVGNRVYKANKVNVARQDRQVRAVPLDLRDPQGHVVNQDHVVTLAKQVNQVLKPTTPFIKKGFFTKRFVRTDTNLTMNHQVLQRLKSAMNICFRTRRLAWHSGLSR